MPVLFALIGVVVVAALLCEAVRGCRMPAAQLRRQAHRARRNWTLHG